MNNNNIVEIKIGRDAESGKLRLTSGGKSAPINDAPVCPPSVSREHALLTVSDEGIITIRNLNIENDLFVNGYGVEQKRIVEPDRIEMGKEHYHLSWDILCQLIPKFADIRPLDKVWRDYEATMLKLEIDERRFGVLRSSTGIITMAAIMLSIFAGRSTLYIVLYSLAGIISLVFFLVAFTSASRVPKQRRQLQKDTEQKYCCPACGCLFSLQKYDQLRQQKRCSHCQAVFIK